MHVCYLSHTSDIQGGGERSLIELIQHVEAAGHRVTLISPPGPLRDEYRKVSKSPHEQVMFRIMRRTRNPLRLFGYAVAYLGSVVRLRRAVRRCRPDVVHANSAPAALFGGVSIMGLGVPMIWHMRDIQPPALTFRLTLPLIGRLSARVLAISRAVRDNLVSFGIPSDKVTILYNAVRPLRQGGGGELRRQHGLDDGTVLLAVVGEMLHRKGQLTAVRAFARVASALPSARLLLCGGNQESDYGIRVKEEARRLGVGDRVLFIGFRRDPGPVFDAADILLVPSNEEPFGRVVVEGLYMGKALVASRAGGIPEIVRDGVDGLLVEPGDDEAMAVAIARLAADPGLRARLGASGRGRAESMFAWERRAEERSLDRVYGNLAIERPA